MRGKGRERGVVICGPYVRVCVQKSEIVEDEDCGGEEGAMDGWGRGRVARGAGAIDSKLASELQG